MEKILTDDIRPQDKNSAFTNAYSQNIENIDLVYDYLTKKFAKWENV